MTQKHQKISRIIRVISRSLMWSLILFSHVLFSSLQILSGLYIGNFRDSKDAKQLDIHKITHILSIHDEARKLFKAISVSVQFCSRLA